MTARLTIHRIGPAATLQDMGREGFMGFGLSRGGAADRHALAEGAALLGQPLHLAAIEMAGAGGEFSADAPVRIALTGSPMAAQIDGRPAAWNACHALPAGARLAIGGAVSGNYGYLHAGGGFAAPACLGSRSAHLAGGIGRTLAAGETIPLGEDPAPALSGRLLDIRDRCDGGEIRILPGLHGDLFSEETRARFAATPFRKTARANRQGAELSFDGAPFAMADQLTILSEPMVPGDIQMTGDGRPFVLLPECQTIGGYPRIGTVLPDDLPRVVQATPDRPLRFRFVSLDEALAAHVPLAAYASGLGRGIRPLTRSVSEVADLLSYQLISGAVTGREEDANDHG